ncbi:MAG: RagB/SusD family nutrient uptake outer membrane protein, partial [Gammaproteobacteria bacterium]|nr:RagB/SusD family nutrient uptake outer membrane protein [Gammaproteobacteria bacterium]
MKNQYNKLTFYVLLCTLSGLISCKKFVGVSPPITQLVTATVFNNSGAATSAVTNIYQQMYSNNESYNMALQTGYLGDELTNYSTLGFYIQTYKNSMTANGTTFGPWTNAYNYIYQANAVIEGLQNNAKINLKIQNQLTGEAKFIRAFWFFYLTNCYGDVPLVTSTNYKVNASIVRSDKNLVYQQIIIDLKDAQRLLDSNYVDASDTTSTSERIRPNKWAATALLARAYLYNKDYTNAEKQAGLVIGNTTMFSLVQDLNSVFLSNSPEAILQLGVPLPNYYDTPDGYYFILQGPPGDLQHQSISPQLLSAFEPGDMRKVDWIGSYTTTDGSNKTYYFPYKYKVYNSTAITEFNMLLRLSEQYLIRAEAEANGAGQGIDGAIKDLNSIRKRAGLLNYGGLATKDSVLVAILRERKVELFTEWGHRWFDMIRTGNINNIMGEPGNVCQSKGGTWSANWALFPIPQSERVKDP